MEALHTPQVELVARARLPLEGLPDTQIVAFRGSGDGEEHVALLVGAFGGKPPLVRLHSECLTGDVFGSLKCDCGPQLQRSAAADRRGRRRGLALSAPGRARHRPRQQAARLCAAGPRARHGRGQRAARLCRRRARLWPSPRRCCARWGSIEVRLLTNNPAKVAGLEAAGIASSSGSPHHMPVNPHNADYLATKRSQERAPGLVFEQRGADPDRGRAEHHRRLGNPRDMPMLRPVTS